LIFLCGKQSLFGKEDVPLLKKQFPSVTPSVHCGTDGRFVVPAPAEIRSFRYGAPFHCHPDSEGEEREDAVFGRASHSIHTLQKYCIDKFNGCVYGVLLGKVTK
jgi:hypothetical protein